MGNAKFQTLLFKYSIILSLSYIMNSLWFLVISYLKENEQLVQQIYYVPEYFRYLINLIVAVLVYLDLKKYAIKNFWIVIITFLFGFFGVGLFFIQVFYKLRMAKRFSE